MQSDEHDGGEVALALVPLEVCTGRISIQMSHHP